MANRWDMTDRDTDAHEVMAWKVAAFHMPLVMVSPPSIRENLHAMTEEWFDQMGGFDFVGARRARPISQDLHDQLLEQSLEEYGDLWRSLAQR